MWDYDVIRYLIHINVFTRLSAASEGENINKRHIYSHNVVLNRSTIRVIRLSWITKKQVRTIQSKSAWEIIFFCIAMFFSSKWVYFIALSLLLVFAYRITSFTNIMNRFLINAAPELTPHLKSKKFNKRRGA